MRRDAIITQPLESPFLSVDKDTQNILKLLLIDSQPYSNYLKRLLIVNEKDCLDDKQEYKDVVDKISVQQMLDEGYIRLEPRLKFGEHENLKSYILLTFDNFLPNSENPEFMDCTVHFDVLCNLDAWRLKNYGLRPLKIVGYIDGIFNILNKSRLNTSDSARRLSGMGEYVYLGCKEWNYDEHLAGYCLTYRALHFTEDLGRVPGNM